MTSMCQANRGEASPADPGLNTRVSAILSRDAGLRPVEDNAREERGDA